MSKPAPLDRDPAATLDRIYPELALVRDRTEGDPVYLVGGAVRDLLLGRGRSDIDLVVEGDAAGLASRLGADVVEHQRFSTAKVRLEGHEIDVAAARTETYARPGALPDVAAAGIAEDLARRDFTINAIAIPLQGDSAPIDPHGGREDLAAGLLRVLHAGSFTDDPTRAVRAARYASRFNFELEPETAALLATAELDTVSVNRRDAELLRLAGEPTAVRGLELAAAWGLIRPHKGGLELAARVEALLSSPPWSELVERDRVLLAAARGPAGAEGALASARPERPSEGVALARGHSAGELVLARALGAEWLDSYLAEWRAVALEIDGADLLGAGVEQGPALGRGLDAAMRAKLDGEICGRDEELAAALRAVREG